ncbi:MAG: hypothetical protein NVSMB27_31920 [Ktedonobacteraceae bacterium]
MADHIGRQLGNYRLIRLLGQGGFADVYLGEHIYLKTPAAIKLLQTRLAQDDMQSFLTEARSIANLVHPNIVRVLEFGIEGETPFLVMDYAPNGTLRQRHPKGSLVSPATIALYIKQVAAALQYAHDQKLVHRDIKPENMLFGRNNEVLLSDFGIAVVAQSSRYQSGGQEVGGTIAYMAPEQLQGRAVPASDQYALGIVVYEWLCGERPFQGSFPEIASQHMLAAPVPLRSRVPGLPYVIEEVVQRSLAKDPQQRFLRVHAFANALDQACQTVPPLIIPSSQPWPNFGAASPGQATPNFGATPQNQTPSGNYGAVPAGQATPNFGATPPERNPSGDYGIIPPVQSTPSQLTPNFGLTRTDQTSGNYTTLRPDQSGTNYPVSPGQTPSGNYGAVPGQTPSGNYGAAPQGPQQPGYANIPIYQSPATPGPGPTPGQFSQNPQNGKNQPPKRGVSRRMVVLGLAGLAGVVVVGGGLAFVAHALQPQGFAVTTGTPTTPINNTPTTAPINTPTTAPTDTPTTDPNVTPTDTPVPTVQTTPGQVLYTANWSSGLNGWSGTGDWKTLNGLLLNDGTNGGAIDNAPTILVPTSLIGIANYAVEAVIQVQSYSNYAPSFGFVLRAAGAGQGYMAGIGTRDYSLNTARISDLSSNDFFNSTRSSPFDPSTKAHTYRVEIKGNDIKLLIDGGLAVELFDNKYLTGERTGLWCANIQLSIQSYKVVAL